MVAVCGFCSALLMLARLAMRKVRRQGFNLSDYLTMVALACLSYCIHHGRCFVGKQQFDVCRSSFEIVYCSRNLPA